MRLNYCKCDLCGKRWELQPGGQFFEPRSLVVETDRTAEDHRFKDLCSQCYEGLKVVINDAIRDRLNKRAFEMEEEQSNVV